MMVGKAIVATAPQVGSGQGSGKELSWRLWYLLVGWLLASGVILLNREWIWLSWGHHQGTFGGLAVGGRSPVWYVLGLADSLSLGLVIAFLIGGLCAVPLIWGQLVTFLSRGLYAQEQVLLVKIGLASLGLLWLALILGENWLVPRMWAFFLSFVGSGGAEGDLGVGYLPSLSHYLKVYVQVMGALMGATQLPILGWLLLRWGWLSERSVAEGRGRPWVWMGSLVLATLLSPPDPGSQIILFLAIIIAYEVLVWYMVYSVVHGKLMRS